MDLIRQTNVVRDMIKLAGDDPERPGLKETPARVIKAYSEMFEGYGLCEDDIFKCFDDIPSEQLVILTGVEFYSTCEHHMLPFMGKAHVGYLPAEGRVVGLSKLARLVDMYARRLQVQERITSQIADSLQKKLQARWCGVVLEAEHFCMRCRGTNKQAGTMVTVDFRSVGDNPKDCKPEFLQLIGHNRG